MNSYEVYKGYTIRISVSTGMVDVFLGKRYAFWVLSVDQARRLIDEMKLMK